MGVIKKGVIQKSTLFEDNVLDGCYYLGYPAPNNKATLKTDCIIERSDKTTFEITCAGGDHSYGKSWALRRTAYTYTQYDGTEDPS